MAKRAAVLLFLLSFFSPPLTQAASTQRPIIEIKDEPSKIDVYGTLPVSRENQQSNCSVRNNFHELLTLEFNANGIHNYPEIEVTQAYNSEDAEPNNAHLDNTADLELVDCPNVNVNGGLLQFFTQPENATMRGLGCSDRWAAADTSRQLDIQYGYVEWKMRFYAPMDIHHHLALQRYTLATDKCDGENIGTNRECLENATSYNIGTMKFDVWTTSKDNLAEVRAAHALSKPVTDPFRSPTTSYSTAVFVPGNIFHFFKIVWTENCITWYLNDREIASVTNGSEVPKGPMHVSMVTQTETVRGNEFSRGIRMEIHHIKYGGQKAREFPSGMSSSGLGYMLTLGIFGLLALAGLILFRGHFRRLLCSRTPLSMSPSNLNYIKTDRALRIRIRTGCEGRDNAIREYLGLFHIPEGRVQIGKAIGKGNFATVYKGQLEGPPTAPDESLPVAVKSFRDRSSADELNLFLVEFFIMADLAQTADHDYHINVMKLIGFHRLSDQWQVSMLLEYCEFGSLRDYLRRCQACQRSSGIHSDTNNNVRQLSTALAGTSHSQGEVLTAEDLTAFAHQISRGMEYLHARGVIHRDLAARNVLVTSDRIVKISDFGLAKHGHWSYTVVNSRSGLLRILPPAFWMPPESILDTIFTQKSDVWSFGVVLWEIFTMGKSPTELNWLSRLSSDDFVASLKSGKRMGRPPLASSVIYTMMLRSWKYDPADRPTFTELRSELDVLVQSAPNGPVDYVQLEEQENCQELESGF